VSTVSLTPVPAEQAGTTCASCGAALVADQRYCLACGQPCSPVRLAFLDVLQNDEARSAVGQSTIELSPAGYVPVVDASGTNGWLRRYSGLLGLFSVLLMCLIVGLLVGHWVTQSKAPPGKQVIEVKGLSAAPAAAAAPASPTAASTAPTVGTPTPSKSSAKAQAEEAKATAVETKVEKAPPPKPVKVTPTKLKKLTQTTGKQHQEEVNALGATPIETG
jgi:hypothetical protein